MKRGSIPDKIIRALLHAVFPNRCAVCDEIIEYDQTICDDCREYIIPHSMPTCHKCGCAISDHDYESCESLIAPVVTAYYYGGRVKRLILNFKDHKRDDIFDEFYSAVTERVAVEYADVNFDMTTSVPSYEKKKYSTSEVISEELARAFMLTSDNKLLIKYRETKKQHRLNQEERGRNLKNSITFNQSKKSIIEGKTILLCDDVKSTGNTLNECVKALYAAGAKKVCCVCIAVSDYKVRIS